MTTTPTDQAQESSAGRSGFPLLACFVTLVLGGALRVTMLRDDFWLDEIWSLQFAARARSLLDILTLPELRHDNNHPLTTWTMHVFGVDAAPVVQRLPALLGSLASLVIVVHLGNRRSRTQAWTLGLVFAVSPAMVAYGAVARGYATAIAFVLLAWTLLAARGTRRDGRMHPFHALLFWLAVAAAVLSHLTAVQPYLGLLCWSAWSALRDGARRRRALARALLWHGPPIAFLFWLERAFVAQLAIGGAQSEPITAIVTRALAWTFGGPDTPTCGVVLAALAGSAWLADAVATARSGTRDALDTHDSREWVASVVAVGVAPALTLVLFTPDFVLPRYFLAAAAILLLSVGASLGRLLAARGAARVLGALLLVAYLGACGLRLLPLLRYGRGEYRAAVRAMAAATGGDVIRVGSDHDLRNGMILGYHGRRSAGKRLEYVPQARFASERPEWFVMHSKTPIEPPQRLTLPRTSYRYFGSYPYAAPDGFHWWLYRREDR